VLFLMPCPFKWLIFTELLEILTIERQGMRMTPAMWTVTSVAAELVGYTSTLVATGNQSGLDGPDHQKRDIR
jgi:hypothetical protein